jgi:Transposase
MSTSRKFEELSRWRAEQQAASVHRDNQPSAHQLGHRATDGWALGGGEIGEEGVCDGWVVEVPAGGGDHLRPLPHPQASLGGDRRGPPGWGQAAQAAVEGQPLSVAQAPANLTVRQQDVLDELLHQPLDTVRAYEFSLRFDEFYGIDDAGAAEEYLRRWIAEVQGSGLVPLITFTRMLEDHWLGVMGWHHSRVSNGLLEGLNSLVQAAKRRARGYRTNRNYIAMIYLVAGKLTAGPAIT